jgi:hypothetical protein
MADKKTTEVTQPPAAVGDTDPAAVKGAKLATEDKALVGGRPDGAILTAQPAKKADQTSYPVPNDADPEDPPVRTTRPDVPIAVSLATGAGQHEPPDPDKYHPDGRPRLEGDLRD